MSVLMVMYRFVEVGNVDTNTQAKFQLSTEAVSKYFFFLPEGQVIKAQSKIWNLNLLNLEEVK